MKNENEKPNFWAVLPATVRYNKTIGSTAKLLFAEITALSNKEGYCWASNSYFSNLYNITETQVSRLITDLKNNGLVKTYINSKEGNLRKIYPQILIQENNQKTLAEKFNEIIGETDFKDDKRFFLEYWTAKNDGGTKEHWQKQKTFAIRQRWNTWIRNKKSWSKSQFKIPDDKTIRKESIQKSINNQIIIKTERTPQEQTLINKRLQEMRKNLGNKLSV